jgi:hypothetical protein
MRSGRIAAVLSGALAGAAARLRARRRRGHAQETSITNLCDTTALDATGAVRSVQTAELRLPEEALEELWTPANLERLARTYWRFLTRATLGLIRVRYTPERRYVVLIGGPLRLLTFAAPEYEIESGHGLVRWRIERGLLVARAGHHGEGHLQIDVRRLPSEQPGRAMLHVRVEVANFYPSIAAGLSRWIYNETQSRIHVIMTNGFLRSLARLDLAESRVGRLAAEAAVAEARAQAAAGDTHPHAASSATG